MADVDSWNAVADAVVSAGDDAAVAAMARALAAYGLSEDDRAALAAANARRSDPAGRLLATVVDSGVVCRDRAFVVDPPPTAAEMDQARRVADALRAAPVDALSDHVSREEVESLVALPADDAGTLVLDLVTRSVALPTDEGRLAGLHGAEAVSGLAPPSRMPVADLLAATRGLTGDELAVVATILARSPSTRLLRGLATAVGAQGDLAAVTAVVMAIASARPSLPEQEPRRPPTQSAKPPEVVFRGGPEDEPGDVGAAAPEPPTAAEPPAPPAPPPPAPPPPPVPPPPAVPEEPPVSTRTAYPRIDLTTHTDRPDVVVVDTPFEVAVGLGPRKSQGIVASGAVRTAAGESTELEVVLVVDPSSLVPTGPTRFTLTVSDADPYPSQSVTFTAAYIEDGPPTRRIGVHYLRDGQVVAVAFRTFACVDEASLVAAAPAVPTRDVALLDLSPAADSDAPDLVVAVCRADTSPTSWVWTAYAASSGVTVPDAPNVAALDGDISGFALDTRRAIQFSTDRLADYLTLAGRAKRIGAAIPDGIQAALHAVITDPARTTAPAVLLLTEELYVPWELGTIAPALSTTWGGSSPFLGAHAAIGRWPLSEHKPRPTPRASVTVRSGAVITADYTGVPGWGKLEHAMAEASAVAALFTPPAASVEPDLVSVMGLLGGSPAADVVHVALHGQFDSQGDQEGIVLISKGAAGAVKATFLTPLEVENGDLAAGPLVFLNACQVGADEVVLGSYGGFATTLLRIGAGAVVAPLWNVDDDVAGTLAEAFYAQTWTAAEPVSVGEAMRGIRAGYTKDAVTAGTAGITATLVAFQVFGHPRMRLTRPS